MAVAAIRNPHRMLQMASINVSVKGRTYFLRKMNGKYTAKEGMKVSVPGTFSKFCKLLRRNRLLNILYW